MYKINYNFFSSIFRDPYYLCFDILKKLDFQNELCGGRIGRTYVANVLMITFLFVVYIWRCLHFLCISIHKLFIHTRLRIVHPRVVHPQLASSIHL